jgi:predicted nucleotidyltransferase
MEITQQNQIQTLAEQYGLLFVVRFGSQAKGVAGPMSDTDILVGTTANLSLIVEAELRRTLAEALGVLEDSIDLSYAEQASGLLVIRAISEGEVLFSKGTALRLAQLRAWRRMQTEKKFTTERAHYVQHAFKTT